MIRRLPCASVALSTAMASNDMTVKTVTSIEDTRRTIDSHLFEVPRATSGCTIFMSKFDSSTTVPVPLR